MATPRSLGGNRLAPHVGVGAAVVFVLGLLLVIRISSEARIANHDDPLTEGLFVLWVLFAPVFTFLVPSFVAGAAGRSFRCGLQAGVWHAIAVLPLTYALLLPEVLRRHALDGTSLFDGAVVPAGENLGLALGTFVFIPLVGFPFAVMGAAAGAWLARNAFPRKPHSLSRAFGAPS